MAEGIQPDPYTSEVDVITAVDEAIRNPSNLTLNDGEQFEVLKKLNSQVNGYVAEFMSEMQQGPSPRFEKLLRFMIGNPHYSPHNTMFLRLQADMLGMNLRMVRSYKQWQKTEAPDDKTNPKIDSKTGLPVIRGFQVAKGQTALRIFVPIFGKRMNEKTGEEEKVLVNFILGPVFADCQLTEEDQARIPDFWPVLADEPEIRILAEHTRLAIVVSGIAVQHVTPGSLGGAKGESRGGLIVIEEELDATSEIMTLVHEDEHERRHHSREGKLLPKPIKELHAEGVTYMVRSHFGLKDDHVSTDYIKGYMIKPEQMRQELPIIRTDALDVIRMVEEQRGYRISREPPKIEEEYTPRGKHRHHGKQPHFQESSKEQGKRGNWHHHHRRNG